MTCHTDRKNREQPQPTDASVRKERDAIEQETIRLLTDCQTMGSFQPIIDYIARALNVKSAEVWEEAAKIAESVIDPVDSPLTALSSQAAKFIAQLIRAAALRVEER
jgi:hypothetical protein